MEVLYRMHETTQLNIWRYSLEYRSYSLEYLEIFHQMHGVIHSNARERSPLTIWNAYMEVKTQIIECAKTHPWLCEITQSDIWKHSVEYMEHSIECMKTHNQIIEDSYRSTKNTHSNTWKYSIECIKSFIRVLKSTHLATWNTEYMNYSLEYMAMLARISEIISWIHWSMLSNA